MNTLFLVNFLILILENQLDSDNEEKEAEKKKAEEEAKKKAFAEEDQIDTEKLRKEKLEE